MLDPYHFSNVRSILMLDPYTPPIFCDWAGMVQLNQYGTAGDLRSTVAPRYLPISMPILVPLITSMWRELKVMPLGSRTWQLPLQDGEVGTTWVPKCGSWGGWSRFFDAMYFFIWRRFQVEIRGKCEIHHCQLRQGLPVQSAWLGSSAPCPVQLKEDWTTGYVSRSLRVLTLKMS